MAQSYRSRFLATQRNNEAAMKALFAQLARDIASEVIKRADDLGTVPRSATFDIQQATGELVRRLFLGRTRTGEWAPFDTVGNGALIPLSPYMRQLWTAIKAATRIPVEQNAVILANKLPADVLTAMRYATRNPFPVAKAMVSEQVFRPNPLAAYDAPHEWVDPNGYRLSDRVWNVTALERRRLDLYLDTAIREGRGALTMSRELEAFLIPGRSLPATNKPYGTTASFDAMRLARTEISQAHQRASVVSAAMNPFVSGMKWNLSASHPRIDICDDLARGGPNGDGVYSIESYPGRPHPQCVTPGQMVTTDRGDIPIEDVQVGDMVLTHEGRYRPVLAVWATPHDGPVYRFDTEQGSFELTGNHPVLLRSGWVNAERLQPGDEVLHAGVGELCNQIVSGSGSFDAIAGTTKWLDVTNIVTAALRQGHNMISREFESFFASSANIAVLFAKLHKLFFCIIAGGSGLTRSTAILSCCFFLWIFLDPTTSRLALLVPVLLVVLTCAIRVVLAPFFLVLQESCPISSVPFFSALDEFLSVRMAIGENTLDTVGVPTVRSTFVPMEAIGSLIGTAPTANLRCFHIHNYSTILTVSTCQYTGKVYNMTVADDHSYTVNGAVVHNCLCYSTNVLIGDPDAMIEQLRADVQAAKREFVDLVGPLEVERFTQLLLGQGLTVERTGVTSRVIAPPIVVQPVVRPVIAPPVVAPPPPVDLAAEARRQVQEIAGEYAEPIAELERQRNRLEIDLLRKPDDRALQRRYENVVSDHRRLVEERDRRSREALYVRNPAQVTINDLGADRALMETWQRGVDEFNRMVSADAIPAQSVRFIDMPALTRSSYNSETGFVRMSADAKERSVVHELGHWLEDRSPDLHRRVVEFYERRTQGYSLEWIGPGFERHEVTRKDKFIDPYMGKEYLNPVTGERRASEIVSMGLDHFFNQAALLARGDPDMFDFIYNLVRGL